MSSDPPDDGVAPDGDSGAGALGCVGCEKNWSYDTPELLRAGCPPLAPSRKTWSRESSVAAGCAGRPPSCASAAPLGPLLKASASVEAAATSSRDGDAPAKRASIEPPAAE